MIKHVLEFVCLLIISSGLIACSGGGGDSSGADDGNNGTSNQSPTATIFTPADGSVYVVSDNISFTGSGNDPEDGALSGTNLQWTSSIDGVLGTGASISSTLTVGTHIITLTASDSLNASGTATNSVTVNQTPAANQSPTATISTPADGSVYVDSDNISFTGSGNDPEDGALSGTALQWTSSIDGVLGTGASISSALSVGAHIITLTVSDSLNASGAVTNSVTVNQTPVVNQSPTATISTPADGSVYVDSDNISFTGSGNDPEDGALSGTALQWTSSIDGVLGTGASISSTLTVGTHVITLTATDSSGAKGVISNIVKVNLSLSEIGRLETNMHPLGIKLVGNLAYVADEYVGLHIVDVSTSTNPVVVGVLNTNRVSKKIAINGSYAYLVSGDNPGSFGGGDLNIIDVSNSNNPVLVKNITFASVANDVEVDGNLVFVAIGNYSGAGSFKIIDVTKPDVPVELSNFALSSQAMDIEIVGNLAFIVERTTGMRIVDISDPSKPSEVGQLLLGSTNDINDVEINGNIAYVANGAAGVKIIDITDLANPAVIGGVVTPDTASDVEINGNLLYVADLNSGVVIYDVSDSSNPLLQDSLDTGSVYELEIAGDLIYVADNFTGFRILDASKPTDIVDIGSVDIPGIFPFLDVAGSLAYIGDTNLGLRIVDISDSAALTEVGRHSFGSPIPQSFFSPRDVDVIDTTVYFVTPFSTRIIDVSNPAATIEIGAISSTFAEDIEVVGNLAYLADSSTLEVHNISNPAAVSEIGNVVAPGFINSIEVDGNIIYVGYGSGFIPGNDGQGVLVVDVTDSTAPVIIGDFNLGTSTSFSVEDVKVVGNTVYAFSWAGLYAIDVTDPTNPVEISLFDSIRAASLSKLSIVGSKLYASSGNVKVVDISNPANMVLLVDSPYISQSWDVEVRNNFIYIADKESGLRILE